MSFRDHTKKKKSKLDKYLSKITVAKEIYVNFGQRKKRKTEETHEAACISIDSCSSKSLKRQKSNANVEAKTNGEECSNSSREPELPHRSTEYQETNGQSIKSNKSPFKTKGNPYVSYQMNSVDSTVHVSSSTRELVENVELKSEDEDDKDYVEGDHIYEYNQQPEPLPKSDFQHRKHPEDGRKNEHHYANNEQRYENNEQRYENNEQRYENNEQRYENNEQRYENNEQRYENNEQRYENNEQRYENNEQRYENNEHGYASDGHHYDNNYGHHYDNNYGHHYANYEHHYTNNEHVYMSYDQYYPTNDQCSMTSDHSYANFERHGAPPGLQSSLGPPHSFPMPSGLPHGLPMRSGLSRQSFPPYVNFQCQGDGEYQQLYPNNCFPNPLGAPRPFGAPWQTFRPSAPVSVNYHTPPFGKPQFQSFSNSSMPVNYHTRPFGKPPFQDFSKSSMPVNDHRPPSDKSPIQRFPESSNMKTRKNIISFRPDEPHVVLNAEKKSNGDISEAMLAKDIQALLVKAVLGEKSPLHRQWGELVNFSEISHVVVVHVKMLSAKTVEKDDYLLLRFSKNALCFEFHPPSLYGSCISNEIFWTCILKNSDHSFINDTTWMRDAVTNGSILNKLAVPDIIQHVPENEKVGKILKSKQSDLFDGISAVAADFETCEILRKLTSVKESETEKCTKISLLLSPLQLRHERFPYPNTTNKLGTVVSTKDRYSPVTEKSKMFGLDCEMCLTVRRLNELTRISIVDENHRLIYDELVQPRYRIIDYLTEFSGITEEMLANVTKTLHEVQCDIRNLLPDDAILVGQSLCNDLRALNMSHPYVIDTGIIYNLTGNCYRKSRLKNLSAIFLNEKIQCKGAEGHDSMEDSLSALKLVQLKLEKGLQFGDIRWTTKVKKPTTNISEEVKSPKLITPKENKSDTSSKKMVTSPKKMDTSLKKIDTSLKKIDTSPKKIDKKDQKLKLSELKSKFYVNIFKMFQYFDKKVLVISDDEEQAFSPFNDSSSHLKKIKFGDSKDAINTLKSSAAEFDFSMLRIPQLDLQNLDSWLTDIFAGCAQNSMMVVLGEDVRSIGKGVCFVKFKTTSTALVDRGTYR